MYFNKKVFKKRLFLFFLCDKSFPYVPHYLHFLCDFYCAPFFGAMMADGTQESFPLTIMEYLLGDVKKYYPIISLVPTYF